MISDTLKTFNPRKRNNVQKAQVVEIDDNPQDFKAAYGAFFANSAQRSANRFGDVLRYVFISVQKVMFRKSLSNS